VTDSLPREEWDFLSCSQKELAACHDYEYARSCSCLPEAVVDIRRTCSIRTLDDYRHLRHLFYPLLGFHHFLSVMEWPETPFLQLDANARARSIGFDESSDEARARKLKGPVYREVDWPTEEIRIWPGATHEEILSALAGLLATKYPQLKEKQGKPQGGAADNRTKKAALRELGVYRLQKRLGASGAFALVSQTKGVPKYANQSSLKRAADKARKKLIAFGVERFLELNDWREKYLPLWAKH